MHDIWKYVARDNVDAADRFRDRIFDAFKKLARTPGMGHVYEGLADETLPVWPLGTYLIIYRPEKKPLQIVRIVSGYRDIATLIRS